MLSNILNRPVKITPPFREKQRQQRSGHWGHTPQQHMFNICYYYCHKFKNLKLLVLYCFCTYEDVKINVQFKFSNIVISFISFFLPLNHCIEDVRLFSCTILHSFLENIIRCRRKHLTINLQDENLFAQYENFLDQSKIVLLFTSICSDQVR